MVWVVLVVLAARRVHLAHLVLVEHLVLVVPLMLPHLMQAA